MIEKLFHLLPSSNSTILNAINQSFIDLQSKQPVQVHHHNQLSSMEDI